MTAVDTMALAQAERTDLVELLATFTPQQWEAPTLCAGWRVRDVIAHMFSYEDLGFGGTIGRFVRGGLRLDRVNALGVAAHADDTPAELLALARRHLRPRGLTANFKGQIALTDAMIHHQDIRRPLGLPREIPPDRLRAALNFGRTAPPLRSVPRIRGLRLVATDLDWSSGDGPVVEGPAETLLMALAGRKGLEDELSGPGLSTLAARISA
ncbi:maleylpyruvate isomerase family mycothiol-dependent enzyme [Pseudonocardia sp. TRM90224]|uniref:maleylpyruvate isomerase family mycothiol-dependent enzyme n=1 Tax=Pseudonocardia sp. TRM90224 TaxID=2812678 RepID=UPI001E5B1579|nr:maleylpyruvate isomerase family mycothiol-dependent enzyme [Pseudonocardia sp. TRM90224]